MAKYWLLGYNWPLMAASTVDGQLAKISGEVSLSNGILSVPSGRASDGFVRLLSDRVEEWIVVGKNHQGRTVTT